MVSEEVLPQCVEVTEKKRLYVGCGLTLAPQAFKNSVEQLKGRLRSDWHVLEFLGLTAGSDADVYQRDIVENVGSCDAFIAVVDEPSLGLGWELAVAVEKYRKPVLTTAHIDSKVTRLLLGAAVVHDNLVFRPYHTMIDDIPGIARNVFADVLARPAGLES